MSRPRSPSDSCSRDGQSSMTIATSSSARSNGGGIPSSARWTRASKRSLGRSERRARDATLEPRRRARRVVAMVLRGRGPSDSPTHGYEPGQLAEDAIAVADGAALLAGADSAIVLAGHGAGAMVAAWTAAELAERCAGLVLVDGGWESLPETTDLDPEEFLRSLEEPPEVLRSMTTFVAERAGFDRATWNADQEQAARATVIEVPAGKIVPGVRPHALEGLARAIFDYRPEEALGRVGAPIVALMASDDEFGRRAAA